VFLLLSIWCVLSSF